MVVGAMAAVCGVSGDINCRCAFDGDSYVGAAGESDVEAGESDVEAGESDVEAGESDVEAGESDDHHHNGNDTAAAAVAAAATGCEADHPHDDSDDE
ncbi:Hypothetical predicted protein [Octopus vulgaris]|uniref:Uncharacterized protein n=1 Tax=Octopus vulgaris TaxID=6645 RepID=A0AA36FQE6_OCTVU|nr:Hypothetical predicted protein [Octopus vulgaris]